MNERARPDLCATVLALEPTGRATFPSYQGRASHALFLRLIEAVHPVLAARLHEDAPVKPFTCGDVWPAEARTRYSAQAEAAPGETWYLRYTTLTAEVTGSWIERVLPALPAEVELDAISFRVREATIWSEEHPAAGHATYAELAAAHLTGEARAPTRWQFAFLTPTGFHSGGMTVPIPLPDLLFGSLLDRWNAWSPVALHPDVRRYAAECTAMSRYRLQTRPVPGRGGAVERGAVGRCTYVALNRDPYWCRTLSALAAYAAYSGAGYQTTQGMGVCRWVE